jgi:hypothetical protein
LTFQQLVAEAAYSFDVENARWAGSRVTRQLTWLLVTVGVIVGVVGVGLLVLVLMALTGQEQLAATPASLAGQGADRIRTGGGRRVL